MWLNIEKLVGELQPPEGYYSFLLVLEEQEGSEAAPSMGLKKVSHATIGTHNTAIFLKIGRKIFLESCSQSNNM